MESRKVFSIGFQKTGTTSLGKALEILGYRVCGYYPFRHFANDQTLEYETILEKAYELTKHYDGFKDTPWPILYKEMDQLYPNSRFILIIRNPENWIKSVVRDFGDFPNSIHQVIYGCGFPQGNEEIWINRYQSHCDEVVKYFHDRPDDLLVLNLDQEETNWSNLAPFLGKAIPDRPWPHLNKIQTKKRKMFLQKISKQLKKIQKPFLG